jgi:uncharacterized protein YjbI with pentapeptide repeats
MAKKRNATPTVTWDQQRFAGKTFAIAGKLTRWIQERVTELIEADGGEVVEEVTATLDYLVVGQVSGKTTLAQKQVEKLQQEQGASTQVLPLQDFWQLVTPDRALAEAILRAGKAALQRWQFLRRATRTIVDLSGSDLRKGQLTGYWLWHVNLDGADLREADLGSALVGALSQVRLDGARLIKAQMNTLADCSACRADLTSASLYRSTIERTDLTQANLSGCHAEYLKTIRTDFSQANLNKAHLEDSKHQEANFTGANLSEADLQQASLAGARLCQANLQQANLSRAYLQGADLTDADLRGASLADADLTGAIVAGANFEGANLVGAKVDGIDRSRAVGWQTTSVAAPPGAGPKLLELERLAGQPPRLTTSAVVDLPDGAPIKLKLESTRQSKTIRCISTGRMHRWKQPASVSAGLLELMRPLLHGALRLDSIKISCPGCALTPKPLRELAVAAWCEAAGVSALSSKELKERQRQEKQVLAQRREQALADLRAGKAGVERWNARPDEERRNLQPYHADLSGARLAGANLNWLNFRNSNFEGADLQGASVKGIDFSGTNFHNTNCRGADLSRCRFSQANLGGALLQGCMLRKCKLGKANLQNADLTGSDLSFADLCGADLSTAVLDKVKFDRTEYDEKTKLPPGFKSPGLHWKGAGPMPRPAAAAPPPKAPTENLDLAAFMNRLPRRVEGGRLANALQMLKAERFQLFSQVEEQALSGVVRSQSSEQRVYSCRLAGDGSFHCCTQNLRVCGGLGGRVCKHLLVLIVGLARAGKVDLGQLDQWISAAQHCRPFLDKDSASAIFLKYKGAEAGEIDWRPTETVPEDFYAF